MVNQTELDRELDAPTTPQEPVQHHENSTDRADALAPETSERPESASIEPASSEESFGALLSEFERVHDAAAHSPQHAEGREAIVVSVSGESVFADIGLKIEGVLPAAALRDKDGSLKIKPGDKLRVSLNGRDEEGYYRLSLIHFEQPKDWSSLESALAEKRTISGTVTGLIKGGVSVDVGVRAFMPASRSGARDVAEMQRLVGQQISCKVIKVDPADNDVVVDRRAVLEEEEARAKDERFAGLREGMILHGVVRNLLDYGAFIDIGGVDGMLHVAEISYGRVNKPADVLAVGQEVDVQILKIDPRKKRISLGMKQLLVDPWTTAAQKYHAGDRVRGAVSRLADFGAFVELEPGLDGLIHLSEMSWSKKVRKPSDIVKPGDTVDVVVLGVNPAEKRISLGLKQALGDPWKDAGNKFAPGVIVEVPVTSLTKFGAFVQLDEYVEGMIHVGDISAEKRLNQPSDELKVGQVVRAVVLEADIARRRIRLGMKQLVPTAADEYIAGHKEGDTVTGRVTDVARNRANVELGDGVEAVCSLASEKQDHETSRRDAENENKPASRESVDLGALTSMLSSKWKGGGADAPPALVRESKPERQILRSGQVRSFRILKLDPEKKRIEVEVA